MALELFGGGAVGAVIGELLKAVIDAKNKVSNFRIILASIEDTLNAVIPRLDEISRLNNKLNLQQNEMKDFIGLLNNGKELVLKCSKISTFSLIRKLAHSKELLHLDNTLLRYFTTILQLDQSRDNKEILVMVRELHHMKISPIAVAIPPPLHMTILRHENVAQVVGNCIDGNLRILGCLHDKIHGAQPGPVLSWARRVKIAVGAAKGLAYLHEAEPRIFHRDISTRNVLLFDADVAKIANFNLINQAQEIFPGSHSSGVDGTIHYYPVHGPNPKKTEVYGFGVVVLELLTGRKPVDQSLVTWVVWNLNANKVRQCIDARLGGNYSPKAAAEMAAVAAWCVQIDPDYRPNMSIVVNALQPLLNAPSRRLSKTRRLRIPRQFS